MPPIKYKQLAEELNRRIAAGEYAANTLLPPRRKLMVEFGVSSRTLHKTFCELKLSGAILPSPQGTRIGQAAQLAHKRKTVFIFIIGGEANGRGQILYTHLCERIMASGWAIAVHDNFAPDFPGFDRFEFAPGDGAIFLFSSFLPEFREPLVRRGIPFVVANRPPAELAVNWADWNHWELFDSIIGRLVAKGARDVHAIFPHETTERPSGNLSAVIADFLAAKKAWSLPVMATDANTLAVFCAIDTCADYLAQLPRLPDATLVFANQSCADRLVAALRKRHIRLPEHFILLLSTSSRIPDCDGFYSEAGWGHLADKLWTLFKHAAANPTANGRGLKQRCTVKYNEGFLKNICFGANNPLKKG